MLSTPENRASAQQWFAIAKDAGPWDSEDGCDCFFCEFGRQLNDPAKLAQLLAEEGKRLDLPIVVCANEPELMRSVKDFAIVAGKTTLTIWDELNDREVKLAEAQTILQQWLALPDGDSERAVLALRSPS